MLVGFGAIGASMRKPDGRRRMDPIDAPPRDQGRLRLTLT
jgi:hypothetical protein